MKKRLKVSVDTLLSHTPGPEPDLHYAKSAQRQAYMSAVEAKYARMAPKASGWRAGRSAITLAGVGLFVMIGAGTLLAQAGQARPGHPLYSLNRVLERTQLALTQDEADKLALKVNFAQERLAEMAATDLTQTEVTAEVATATAEALSEIDNQLDQTKIALELNEPTNLSREDVEQVDAQLKQTLETYQLDTAELFRATENTELAETVAIITDVEQGLISQPITEGEGYYLRLSGQLTEDAKRLGVFERELALSGALDATVLAGSEVKVNGWFSEDGFAAEMINVGDTTQLALHLDEQTIFSYSAQLQQDEAGYFMAGPNQQRIDLTGEVTEDDQMTVLVGQEVSINSAWRTGKAELIHVMAGEGDAEVVLPAIEDPDLPETGESLPATDPEQPGVPTPTPTE